MALAEEKCEACSVETPALSHDEVSRLGNELSGWDIGDVKIEKTFKFPNFVEAMKFANKITQIAENENHHPDLHISWGKVRVELSTHSINGLSKNDFIVAAKIDQLPNTNIDDASHI